MPRMIFVNLPVTDLEQSIRFYEAIGGRKEPKFSNEMAAMIVLSDAIHVMLLTYEKFKYFTPKEICDAAQSTEVLVCLSAESRERVDEMVRNAVVAGGSTYNDPQDHGFMYGHGFQDLDGHIWEVIFMEPSAIRPD